MPHEIYKDIRLKDDGSFVVNKNGLPYHVPNGYGYEGEWEEITNYLLTHPDEVTPYVEPTPPEPTEEELAQSVRWERDKKIKDTEARINRYNTQKAAKLSTTDTKAWYDAALLYLEELRNVPEQEGFPVEVKWPESPDVKVYNK